MINIQTTLFITLVTHYYCICKEQCIPTSQFTVNTSDHSRPLEVHVVEYLMNRTCQKTTDETSDTSMSASDSSYLSTHCSATITELGGDSLTAMRLSSLLKQHLSVEISAQVLLTCSFQQLLEIVSPQNVNPLEKSRVYDWDEETSLDFLQSYLNQKKEVFQRTTQQLAVCLTGATGFLGRFILLELLQSAIVNKVYCIVKGKSGK